MNNFISTSKIKKGISFWVINSTFKKLKNPPKPQLFKEKKIVGENFSTFQLVIKIKIKNKILYIYKFSGNFLMLPHWLAS
jgi:hypothetical protein